MKYCIVLLLLIVSSVAYAAVVELYYDDGSFEQGRGVIPGAWFYGNRFDMPTNYSLLTGKTYHQGGITPNIAHICIYEFYAADPYGSILLGEVIVEEPGLGWIHVDISSIAVPNPPPSSLLIVDKGTCMLGADITPPIEGYWYYNYTTSSWSFSDAYNDIGIRLIIEDNPVSAEPASLGGIKAMFH